MRSGNQKNHGIDLRVKGSGRGQYKAGQESSRTPDTFVGLTRLSRKPVNPEELPAQATRVCPISSLKSAFDTRHTLVWLVSSLDFASNLGKRISPK